MEQTNDMAALSELLKGAKIRSVESDIDTGRIYGVSEFGDKVDLTPMLPALTKEAENRNAMLPLGMPEDQQKTVDVGQSGVDAVLSNYAKNYYDPQSLETIPLASTPVTENGDAEITEFLMNEYRKREGLDVARLREAAEKASVVPSTTDTMVDAAKTNWSNMLDRLNKIATKAYMSAAGVVDGGSNNGN